MSGLIRSAIKSIQRVSAPYVAGDTDVTISGVNLNKSIIGNAYFSAPGSNGPAVAFFVNSTTVRLRGGPSGITYYFDVIEYS